MKILKTSTYNKLLKDLETYEKDNQQKDTKIDELYQQLEDLSKKINDSDDISINIDTRVNKEEAKEFELNLIIAQETEELKLKIFEEVKKYITIEEEDLFGFIVLTGKFKFNIKNNDNTEEKTN